MFFGLNFFYSLLYSYFLSHYCRLKKYGIKTALLYLIPLFILWIAICGGQDEVGTDYGSYLSIFNGEGWSTYESNYEYVFLYIIQVCHILGIKGQYIFYIFYSINFLFLSLIIKRLKSRQIFIFVLLYFVVTSLFNNQLNILRQTTSCYIGTYASILIIEKKKIKGLLFILLAFLIHKASVVFLIIPLFNNKVSFLSKKKLLFLMLACFIIGFIIDINLLLKLIPILPDNYALHITGGYVQEQELLFKLTKYIYLPIYLFSIKHKYDKASISIQLYNWGIISFCMRMLFINLTIVSRIADFFLILSIFPLLYYLSDIGKERSKLYYAIIIFLVTFYSLKVLIFPSGEYLYKSIYY